MITSISKPGLTVLALFAALSCAPLAPAQDQMTLTGVGNGYVMGGVYVSPYQGEVTDNGNLVYSGYVICDDFATDSYLNTPWNVNVTQSAASLTGQQKFTTPNSTFWNSSYSIQQDYDAVAWLAANLMNPVNMNNETEADEYSYAIWSIFDVAAQNSITGVANLSQAQVVANVNSLISSAYTATAGGKNVPTVTVYSPNPKNASQEFLVVQTPEPAGVDLGFGLTALLGAAYLVYRRTVVSGGTSGA